MYNIKDQEIDFMLRDIEARGVTLADLQDNLLDHMCCIIEYEKPDEVPFHKFYESILPRFFKKELKEIQEETDNLLTFRNYYAMIKTLKISGIITAVLTIIGSIFKTMHWPGAGLLIVMGTGMLCAVFLPLMIALKFKKEEKMADKVVLSFGFLLGIGAAVGILFKLMHWPLAFELMRWSVTLFLFVYVPLYYFTQFRNAENKLNTTVNTVLMVACGGLIYAMFNLNHNDPNQQAYVNMLDELNQETRVLIDKNNTLVQNFTDQAEVTQFHNNSKALYDKLEQLKQELLGDQNGSKLVTIEQQINNYNHLIHNLDLEGKMEKTAMDKLWLDNVAIPHLISQISIAQKQLMNNEHKYLSKVIAQR